MTALLLAWVLFTFDPSPDPVPVHLCRAWQRVMTWDAGEPEPVLSPLFQAGCEATLDEFGWMAVAGCEDLPGQLCAVCISAVDDEGDESECGEVTGYVEDLP